METGERWRLGHRPALDGLRGVAVLLVVEWHAFHAIPWLHGAGAVGVATFFALSGFLITGLLLEEHARTGTLDLIGFLRRRALRLLPALLAFLAVLSILNVELSGIAPIGVVGRTLLYAANWGPTASASVGALGHMWSLSVEEQFYLAFPVVAWLALRWRGRVGLQLVCWVALGLSLADRAWLSITGASAERIYYGTDTAAYGLLVGCALACWLAGRTTQPPARPRVGLLLVVGLIGVAACGGQVGTLAAAPLTAAIIMAFGASESALTSWPARWLGQRSYGLYLWHLPVLHMTMALMFYIGRPGWCLVGLAVALPIAAASYRFVERPFLRLKGRARSTRRPADSTPASTATAAPALVS